MTRLIDMKPDHWWFISEWLEATEFFTLLCSGSRLLLSTLQRSPLARLAWNFNHQYSNSSFKHTFNSLKADAVVISSSHRFRHGIYPSLAQAATRSAQRSLKLIAHVRIDKDLLEWWSRQFEERKSTNPLLDFHVGIPEIPGLKKPLPTFLPPTLETLHLTIKMSAFAVAMLPRTLKSLNLELAMSNLKHFNQRCTKIVEDLPNLETLHVRLLQMKPADPEPFELALSPSIKDFSITCQASLEECDVIITGTPTLRKLKTRLADAKVRFENMAHVTHLFAQIGAIGLKAILETMSSSSVQEQPTKSAPLLKKFVAPQTTLLVPSRHPSSILPSLTHLTVFETDFTMVEPIKWPITITRLEILDCDIAIERTGLQSPLVASRFYYAMLPPNLKYLVVSGHLAGANSRIHLDARGNVSPPLSDAHIVDEFKHRHMTRAEPIEMRAPYVTPSTDPQSGRSIAQVADNLDRVALHLDATAIVYDSDQQKRWNLLKSYLCDFAFTREACNTAPLPCAASLETLILKGAFAVVSPDATEFLPSHLKHFEATLGLPNPKLFPDDGCHFYPTIASSNMDALLVRLKDVKRLKLERNVQSLTLLPASDVIDVNDTIARGFIDSFSKSGIDIESKLRSGDWKLPDWRLPDHLPSQLTELSIVSRPSRPLAPSKFVAPILNALHPITNGSSQNLNAATSSTLTTLAPSSSSGLSTSSLMDVDKGTTAQYRNQAPLGSFFKIAHFDYSMFYHNTLAASLAQNMVRMTLDTLSAHEAYSLSRVVHSFRSLVSLRVLRSSSRVGFHRSFIPPMLEELVWDAGPLLSPLHPTERFTNAAEAQAFNPPLAATISLNLKRLIAPLDKFSIEEELLRVFANFPNLEQVSLLPSPTVAFFDVDCSMHTPLEDYTPVWENTVAAKHRMLVQRNHASLSRQDFLARMTHSSSSECPLKSSDLAASFELDDTAADFGLSDPSLCPPSVEFSGQGWSASDANEHDQGFIGLRDVAKFLTTHCSVTATLGFATFSLPDVFDRWIVPDGVHTIDLANPYKMLIGGKEPNENSDRRLPSLSWYSNSLALDPSTPGPSELDMAYLPSTLTRLSLRVTNGVSDRFWTHLPAGLRILHLFGASPRPLEWAPRIEWKNMPRGLEDFFVPAVVLSLSLSPSSSSSDAESASTKPSKLVRLSVSTTAATSTDASNSSSSHQPIPSSLWRVVLGKPENSLRPPTVSSFAEHYHTQHAPQSLLLFQLGPDVLIDRRDLPKP